MILQSKLIQPVLTAGLFALVFVAGRYLKDTVPPATMSFIRYAFASAVFIPFLIGKRQEVLSLTKRAAVLILCAAALGIVVYHLLFFQSLHFTTATNSSLIHASNPLLVLILSKLVLKEILPPRALAGFILSALGVLAIMSEGTFETFSSLRVNAGTLLMLTATVSWALYTIILKKVAAPQLSTVTIIGLISLVGCVMLIPFGMRESMPSEISALSLSSWVAIAYMGIGSSGLGYFLYTRSARMLGPSLTSLSVYSLVPVWASLIEWWWLGSGVLWIQILGFILISTGLFLALLYRQENLH